MTATWGGGAALRAPLVRVVVVGAVPRQLAWAAVTMAADVANLPYTKLLRRAYGVPVPHYQGVVAIPGVAGERAAIAAVLRTGLLPDSFVTAVATAATKQRPSYLLAGMPVSAGPLGLAVPLPWPGVPKRWALPVGGTEPGRQVQWWIVYRMPAGQSSDWCAFHYFDPAVGVYSFLPAPEENGCWMASSFPALSLGMAASHEYAEAATDPIPGRGWVVGDQEIADVCGPVAPNGDVGTLEAYGWLTSVYDRSSGACSTGAAASRPPVPLPTSGNGFGEPSADAGAQTTVGGVVPLVGAGRGGGTLPAWWGAVAAGSVAVLAGIGLVGSRRRH